MKSKAISFTRISILLLAVCVSLIHISRKSWEKESGVINWDVVSYYAYLPATFIFHDIKLEKKESFDHGTFWPEKTSDGKNVIKTTMGLSFLYAPFFGLAHAYSLFSGSDAWGFSSPYQIALIISSLFYFIGGLFFLRKVLLRFFSEKISALTILIVVAGTNLAYYVSYDSVVSHGYIFALSSLFLWLVICWHDSPNKKTSFWIGGIAGLLTLIRPTNILILLYFALFDIKQVSDIRQKFNILITKPAIILIMIVGFLMPWIPQFIYWKITTGQFMFYSYTSNETFLFGSPKLAEVLFGFRKGWFIYTPTMILGIAGLFTLRNKLRPFLFPTIALLFTFTYLVSCWWCWWFGGSYGMRPMIDIYAFLTIPIAGIITFLLAKDIRLRSTSIILIFGLIGHNIFQMNQYLHGAIHYAFMTNKAYCISFGHIRPQSGFYEALEEPDPEPAKLNIQSLLIHREEKPVGIDSSRIKKYYFDGVESKISDFKNNGHAFVTGQAFSETHSVKLDLEHPFGFELRIPKQQLGKQILVRVKKYGKTGRVVIRAQKENEYCVSSGDSRPLPGTDWEQQEFLINSPILKKSDYIQVFCCNPVNQLQYYDEMEVYILN